ncbi:helix-turn-helix domain-containing protein [Nonomuraea sp. K274]|uniref:Helix-turn-helix domain-containing protein n=1 Tax=Nonomuraea cypriaca TaxID=1187855 RepID=A0A931ALR9_9ACTN|nr:helix-turn-helix domain-containing protein [Nonomuraea cypriaca]MBF8193269.1 helix-turn-helix domain-containing protein [Nonomuraea cypriaca]
MPRPIPDNVRQNILDDINAGEKSRNQIARDHNVSVGTVTNIAKRAGLTTAFDRSATKNATEAAKADNAALRAATSRRLLVKANELLDQMDQPHLAFNFGGKDNTYNEKQLPKPPVSDLRNLMTAAAVAVDKHLVIEKHDNSGESHAAVDAWLTEMGA